MGLISIRRLGSEIPTVVCEDIPQAVEQPIGAEIGRWFQRAAWLREHDDARLPAATPVAGPDLVHIKQSLLGDEGWRPALTQLRQSRGMRWELETDEAVSALVAACTGALPLRVVLGLVAAAVDGDEATVAEALLPVVRDLVQRGFLLPGVI
jgi:hypothetical protein